MSVKNQVFVIFVRKATFYRMENVWYVKAAVQTAYLSQYVLGVKLGIIQMGITALCAEIIVKFVILISVCHAQVDFIS